MMQLLDGILLLAKTEAGKSSVEETVFDLHREMVLRLCLVKSNRTLDSYL
jgi:hypothetical protein